MNVNIRTVHFDAASRLLEHVNKKVQKLNNFHDRITNIDVYLKLENVSDQVKDKIAEIKVNIPRYSFFSKESSKSFEASFDGALDSIIEQIKRRKR